MVPLELSDDYATWVESKISSGDGELLCGGNYVVPDLED